jgi:hypothetical protein
VSLAAKPVNQFFKIELPISPTLREKLSGYYNDLQLRFVLSAPAATYHFDSGSWAGIPGQLASQDVGNTGAPGGYTQSGGSFTIQGAGEDIEYDSDKFHFLYRSLSGDGQVVVKLNSFNAQHPWAKVGLMIRDSLLPNAKNAMMMLRPQLGSGFQFREQNGGGTLSTWQDEPELSTWEHRVRYFRLPKWLKMIRQGNLISVYASNDGLCWGSEIWKQTLNFDDDQAFYGVAVTSGSRGTLASANVSNFSVKGVVEPVNASCDRAAVDGDFPWSPVASDWIVPPARFALSPVTWNYTTTNPNGSVTPSKCNPHDGDDPGNDEGIAWRQDGPDHPDCPAPNVTPAWTTVNFGHNTPGWQFGKPAGFGRENLRVGDKVQTVLDTRGIWLRKTFTLSSQTQKDNLVFWGRWGAGVSIYINGKLATSAHDTSFEYRYLGLSDAARAALNVGGTNVIAVRLEWERYRWQNGVVTQFDADEKYFDLGITTSSQLANLPTDRMPEPLPALKAYTDKFREFMHELGMPGAAIAVRKDGQTVVETGIGWKDKNLTQQMPRGAILRLASVDKMITAAAIVKLIQEGVIAGPHTPAFQLLLPFPVQNFGPGVGVNAITVEQLRTHTSGIGLVPVHWQTGMDEMAFKFGITTNNWNKHYMASWLYSQNVTGRAEYSSDGYALLRYLIERVTNKSLNAYLSQNMGLSEIVVSGERLANRQQASGELGYITHEEPWDRWGGLDDYLALSASAEGLTKFFDNFYPHYALEQNGTYTGHGGGFGGAMSGTWSFTLDIPERNLSWAVVANSISAFDAAPQRIFNIANDAPCLFGFEDPRTQLNKIHFIQNVAQPTRQIHHEDSPLAAAPAKAEWWNAQWYPELVSGTTFYRLRSRGATAIDGTPRYLRLISGALQVSPASASAQDAHWALEALGGNVFRIKNRANSTSYLHVQNGPLVAGPIQTSWTSARWNFCD